jgi:hypothetical protein
MDRYQADVPISFQTELGGFFGDGQAKAGLHELDAEMFARNAWAG